MARLCRCEKWMKFSINQKKVTQLCLALLICDAPQFIFLHIGVEELSQILRKFLWHFSGSIWKFLRNFGEVSKKLRNLLNNLGKIRKKLYILVNVTKVRLKEKSDWENSKRFWKKNRRFRAYVENIRENKSNFLRNLENYLENLVWEN